MKTLTNIALMGAGTVVKMVAGLLALAVLARTLGADGFGSLMVFLSAAGVLCVVSSLGLNTFVLREIAREPHSASATIADTLVAKLFLVVVTCVLALILAVSSRRFGDPVFLILLLTLLAEGFTEFFNIGLRATGQYALEARQSLLAALLNSSLVISAALVGDSLIVVAIAYLVSRVLVTLLAFLSFSRRVGAVRLGSAGAGLRCLRNTVSYSIDAALSALFGQVDGVVLGAYLSLSAVGIYQGGLRIFMSALTGAGILTNVYLPKAAAELAAGRGRPSAGCGQVVLAYAGFGLVVGGLFALLLPALVEYFYGEAFAPLKTMLPWFGLLFAARMVAGAWGVLLTAKGEQRFRSIGMAAHWGVIAVIGALSIPAWAGIGWIVAMLGGTVFLGLVYASRAFDLVTSKPLALCASLSPLLLLPFLRA